MSAAQLLRQAESLKAAVADTGRAANEAWVSRQNLQDLYQKILVLDLEYALDKKVEQDLWNHAFKNQISTLQAQVKDKQNPKRGEIQASLNLFLETASGFYLLLLQELCSAFQLDLPFRCKPLRYGILQEYGPVMNKIRLPKHSSSLYICQHCLVHLGDIARYRQQIDEAQTFYKHAGNLVAYNGQPYNQLAILEAAKGDKLSTVFFYVRSIAVKHPFPVANTNMEKLFAKLSKDGVEAKGKLPLTELMTKFLQFHACVHAGIKRENTAALSECLLPSFLTHISSASFTAHQLVQLTAINLFSIRHAKKRFLATQSLDESLEKSDSDPPNEEFYELIFNFHISFFDTLLNATPKYENKSKDYQTLPAIKVILDWLLLDEKSLSHEALKQSTIWSNLSKLLNNLQLPSQDDLTEQIEKDKQQPLTEDFDLRCFLPIYKAHTGLDFQKSSAQNISSEAETRLRCLRLAVHAVRICEEFPSLNLLAVNSLKSGRLQFSAPTALIKIVPGPNADMLNERKSSRQNVAIQAILSNQAAKKGQEPVKSEDKGSANPPQITIKARPPQPQPRPPSNPIAREPPPPSQSSPFYPLNRFTSPERPRAPFPQRSPSDVLANLRLPNPSFPPPMIPPPNPHFNYRQPPPPPPQRSIQDLIQQTRQPPPKFSLNPAYQLAPGSTLPTPGGLPFSSTSPPNSPQQRTPGKPRFGGSPFSKENHPPSTNPLLNQLFHMDDQPFQHHPPKPDSPKMESVFSMPPPDDHRPMNANNTYSLFSQSPWLSKQESNGSASSPFSSNSSSLSATPVERNSPSAFGGGLAYGQSHTWSAPISDSKPLMDNPQVNSMQSLWSAGPSPLEKLLEVQRNQRQCDAPPP